MGSGERKAKKQNLDGANEKGGRSQGVRMDGANKGGRSRRVGADRASKGGRSQGVRVDGAKGVDGAAG